jgi:TRAP-type C4-dicarboxylate transport system substrate-binding protein
MIMMASTSNAGSGHGKATRVGTGLLAATVVAMAALFSVPGQAQEKVTLRFASFMPPQGFLPQEIVVPFLDKVVADSEGTLAYDYFPGGTLGRAPAQQLSLVQSGTADIVIAIPSYTPGAFEGYNVSQLPGVAATTRAASVGMWKAYEQGTLPTPDDVVVLGLVTTASNLLHTKEPFETLGDFDGLRLRAPGTIQTSVIEKLNGAVIGNIAPTEIAEGLSRGLLDGTLMDWIGIREFRIDPLTTNHGEMDLGRLTIMLPMNRATFESLPEPAKAAFMKHGGLAFAEFGGQAFDDAVDEFRASYVERGDNVTQLDDADTARLEAVFDEVIADWVTEEPGRQEVLDAFRGAAALVQ